MRRGKNLRKVELGSMSSTFYVLDFVMGEQTMLISSGLTWDEANIALTEIQKDSLMSVSFRDSM